jgi:transposase
VETHHGQPWQGATARPNWRHTRKGDKYVTVIIDLTPIRDNTGPARLLDMVEGRSKQAFKSWLAERDDTWRQRLEVVAMDGFTGFKTATAEELPTATAVMDPFHVVRLAGDALDGCRRRVQQQLHGHRGRTTDPLYRARRTLHTGADLITVKQLARLETLFAGDDHTEVQATWAVYQDMIAAYREPDRVKGRTLMAKLIDTVSAGVPSALQEVSTLGRTQTVRRTLIQVAARIANQARHWRLHLPQQWPWQHQLATLYTAALGPPAAATAT